MVMTPRVAVVLVSVILAAAVALSACRGWQRRRETALWDRAVACGAMEEALESAKASLELQEGTGVIGLDGWTPVFNAKKELVLPGFDASAYQPVLLSGVYGVCSGDLPRIMAYTVRWDADDRGGSREGFMGAAAGKGLCGIYAAAKYHDATRCVEAVHSVADVNVWHNALFVGAGNVNGAVRGGATIAGSVHILGDALLAGGIALESATDLTGNPLVQNDYDGMPDSLKARAPALDRVTVNGKKVETLHAALRVKHGLVGIYNEAHVGRPFDAGSTSKGSVDGTYVTDGWIGNRTVPDGNRGVPAQVHSDNGWSAAYDLGDRVAFPALADPWRDPAGGKKALRSDGTPYTHEEFFVEVLVAKPGNAVDGIYSGGIHLDLAGDAFYWNAATGDLKTGQDAVLAGPGAEDDYILFDPSASTLRVNGQIYIDGGLSLSGREGADTVYYSGRCAILATQDVAVDVNLLPCNNGQPLDCSDSYPTRNCLGIMTKARLLFGNGNNAPQLNVCGAFYALERIVSAKQTNVLGTLVASEFDMGAQVPNIYQVPALAQNLPVGMAGNFPILSLTRVSLRELEL